MTMDISSKLPIKKPGIKTFTAFYHNAEELDTEVNEWIDANMDVEIIDVKTTSTHDHIFVTLIYSQTYDVDWTKAHHDPPEIISK